MTSSRARLLFAISLGTGFSLALSGLLGACDDVTGAGGAGATGSTTATSSTVTSGSTTNGSTTTATTTGASSTTASSSSTGMPCINAGSPCPDLQTCSTDCCSKQFVLEDAGAGGICQ